MVTAPTASDAPDFFLGEATGLLVPAHADALAAAGAEFLTRALHAYGSLAPTDRIARIVRIEPCLIGSTGQKLFVEVAYAQPENGLATELFVKFSRHFSDPFHDRRRFELQSEIQFLALSNKPGFPISVPRPYFADHEPESGTGVLIVESIPFGQGAIEPLRAKCMDHQLADPLAHYRAILTALAKLAGAHHAGGLSPELERFFPFDAAEAIDEDPIPYSEAELRALVADYADFAAACPQLFPASLRTADFIARLEGNVIAVARRQRDIRRHLHEDPRFVALTHFNPNIDNAWFWRDGTGELVCGLFDWQRARQMNVGYALWGGLCGAGQQIWTGHLHELLAGFVEQFHASGGPLLPIETLTDHLHLYAATIGIAGLLNAPAMIRSRLPDIDKVSGPLDPVLLENEGARCFLHVFTIFLGFWDMHDFSTRLDAILAGIPAGEPGGAAPINEH